MLNHKREDGFRSHFFFSSGVVFSSFSLEVSLEMSRRVISYTCLVGFGLNCPSFFGQEVLGFVNVMFAGSLSPDQEGK